jgi:hypothetical protein
MNKKHTTNLMTLARLMLISRCGRLIQHVFSALDIEKLSGEYIGGFGLMRQQVDHAVD